MLLVKLIDYHQQQQQREIINKVVRELETKVQELEDGQSCSICMERSRNVAFLCGHTACSTCAQPLKTFHICRKPITKKNKSLFISVLSLLLFIS